MDDPKPTRAELLETNRELRARIRALEAALAGRSPEAASPGSPGGNGHAPSTASGERNGRSPVEEALRTSQGMLQTILDTLPIGVQIKGTDQRYVLVNKALATIYGREPDEILHRTFAELGVGTAEEREAIAAADRRVLESGERVEISEQPLNIPSGSKFWRRGVKAPLRDDTGETVGLVGVMVDVTGPIGTAQRLRESQRLFQAVLDIVPHAIFVKDVQGRYLMANRRKGELHGMSVEELIGSRLDEVPFTTPAELDAMAAMDRQVFTTGQPAESPGYTHIGADGRPVWRHVLKLPYLDEAGNLIGLVGVSEDISERRQIEAQLRHLQKMEAIGTMAGGIAHDFNNILFPILGFTELTLETLPPSSEEHEQLVIVRDAAIRARDIVAQLLQFSRQTETQPTRLHLHIMVKEALRLLRSTLPATIRFEEQTSERVAPVLGDVTQLHQALVNLCVNAGHAMPDGGVLTVSVEDVELKDFRCGFGKVRNGPHVRLTVADTGSGMDEETLAHIFDPFYTTRPVGQGSGLGLSAVLGIVEQHEGGLNVISSPGEGSRFEIYLEALQKQESAPEQVTPPPPGSGTILLVDDEEAVTALGKRMLEEFGYSVRTFNSGREALEAFAARPSAFDLVISDVIMPELGGAELIRELRHIREDIPIILGSGYDRENLTRESAFPELDGFFRKPITKNELGNVVREALERRRGGEQARLPAGP